MNAVVFFLVPGCDDALLGRSDCIVRGVRSYTGELSAEWHP